MLMVSTTAHAPLSPCLHVDFWLKSGHGIDSHQMPPQVFSAAADNALVCAGRCWPGWACRAWRPKRRRLARMASCPARLPAAATPAAATPSTSTPRGSWWTAPGRPRPRGRTAPPLPAVRGPVRPSASTCMLHVRAPAPQRLLAAPRCGGEPAFWSTACSLCDRGAWR